jgi:hypothetical protein
MAAVGTRVGIACDAVVYGPPFAKHSTALEGPAAVMISNIT